MTQGAGQLVGGRYRLEQRIAGGGMATVWEALDEVLARRVAVKVLHPHLAADEQFVARFKREAVAVARLTHPSIVSIFDTCSEAEGGPGGSRREAIVMELVRGSTLRAELDRRGRFEPDDAVAVVSQIADALQAAHEAGIVHRDVKPANVLLSDDGRVLVADFGIAKATDGLELTGEGMTLGTAKYLAPEQVEGKAVDGRTDVYAAGVILYELVCGSPPFEADTEAATALARLHRDPTSPRTVRPEVSHHLEAVILRALARDPDDRFASATELRDNLRAVGRGLPAPRPAAAPTPSPAGSPDATGVVDATSAAGHTRMALPSVPPPSFPPPSAGAARGSTPRPPMATPGPPMAAPSPPAGPGRRRPPPPPASPAQPSRRRRQWGLALTGALVVGAGIIALVLALQTGDDDGPPGFERDTPPIGSGAGIGLAAFDPPPGDGAENDRAVAAAADGDTSTAWRSECYRNAAFGGLKEGVGLVVELPEERSIEAVGLIASPAGWSADVHVADEPGARLDDWGPAVGSIEAAGDGQTTVELDDADGRFVLVFFTALSPDPNPDCGGANPFAVTVSELVVSQD